MENLISKIDKNKKWIRLGFATICLLIFCFPLIKVKIGSATLKIPYIIYNCYYPMTSRLTLEKLRRATSPLMIRYYAHTLIIGSISTALLYATVILSIISVFNSFKHKNFNIVWALLTASINFLFRAIIYKGISMGKSQYGYHLSSLAYIVFALLILDVIYLIIERKYLPRLTANSAENQNFKDASI